MIAVFPQGLSKKAGTGEGLDLLPDDVVEKNMLVVPDSVHQVELKAGTIIRQ